MKTAVIGLGTIGVVHMQILINQGMDIVAICDIREDRMEKYPNYKHFTDYKKILDDESIDCVHICTPHYLHKEMVCYFLERNVNVLCEKPLAISALEIDEILECEKKANAQLGVCLQNRYNPVNAYVKDYLKDKNVIDGHASVLWNRDEKYYKQDAWRGKWKTEGGGVLINQAIHTLDLIEWFIGVPETVTATISNLTLNGVIEVEDSAFCLFKGKNNFSFFATNGSHVSYEPELTICTDKEKLHIYTDKVLINDECIKFDRILKVYGKDCYGTGHENLIADFYDCIKTGKKFVIDGCEGSKVVRLVLSCYKSNGRTIKIL